MEELRTRDEQPDQGKHRSDRTDDERAVLPARKL
jgi:hypothetical protein